MDPGLDLEVCSDQVIPVCSVRLAPPLPPPLPPPRWMLQPVHGLEDATG